MARFSFKITDLAPIVEGARLATEHKPTWGQTGPLEAALWLVKDQGVYLMGNQVTSTPVGTTLPVVYAAGHGPSTHLGGDDYCELIPLSSYDAAVRAGADTLTISVTARSLKIGYIGPVAPGTPQTIKQVVTRCAAQAQKNRSAVRFTAGKQVYLIAGTTTKGRFRLVDNAAWLVDGAQASLHPLKVGTVAEIAAFITARDQGVKAPGKAPAARKAVKA